jgi:CTP:molybdopterin cytidylyltransferase MocA
MGVPKALLAVEGTPLLLHHIRAFSEFGLRITVVVGAHRDALLAVLPPTVRVVENPDWASTQPADSAWLALTGLGPALLTPVDTPPARAADLRRLLDAPGPAVLQHAGVDGHPVRLDPPHPRLRLDERLRHATRLPTDDPGVVRNLNTPAEWADWLARR